MKTQAQYYMYVRTRIIKHYTLYEIRTYVCMYNTSMHYACARIQFKYKDGYRAISNADSKHYYIRIYTYVLHTYVRTCMHFHYFW